MPVHNKRIASVPIAIHNPNGEIMYSTHTAELFLPDLPLAARQVHIVPALESQSLISIGQFCDAGCTVAFTATTVTVSLDSSVILTGQRTALTRLWQLDVPSPSPSPAAQASAPSPHQFPVAQANSAIGSATPAELVAFAHASLFSPSLSTLSSALAKGHLTNFPGLSTKLLLKYPPHSVAMIKGHLDQTRKNQRSTKATIPGCKPPMIPASPDDSEDNHPASLIAPEPSHNCFVATFEPTGQIYTDQTGKFVAPSSNGNNYLLVLYDYDSNCILAEPMKTRTAKSILTAFQTVHAKLCKAGLRPKLQRLDNECSAILKEFLSAEDIDFQLVPPHVHRRNAAERAIRTFKNHFIAGLCSVDKNFPLHLWDRLLPQALITLNLLRSSRLHPQLSAWAQFNGLFDFNKTPLAPPGIRVLVHEKPAQRTTWSPHALDGWYTGPALDSYRCHRVWIWETRLERICDTISWFPTKVTMPLASSNDIILASLLDLTNAISNPSASSPLAPLADSHVAALQLLTKLLTGLATPAPALAPLASPTSPAPALRVPSPASPSPAPALVVPSPASPSPAPALRVPSPINASPTPALRVPSPSPAVPSPSLPATSPNDSPPASSPTDSTSPPPSLPPATYENSTGIQGRRRRRAKKPRQVRATTRTSPRNRPATRSNPSRRLHSAASATLANDDLPFHPHLALHGNAFNPDTGQIAEYKELSTCSEGALWRASCADEIGRLCHGHGANMPTGTETMVFIPVSGVPKGTKATYLRIVAAFRPEKANPRRVRFTVGGDRVYYDGDVSTKTADLTTVKTVINSVISTPNGKFVTADLKDFYLETPMDKKDYAYMRIPVSVIPDSIMLEYDLAKLVHNGHVYVEIRKGMYGLPQAGRLANDRLVKFLAPHGYAPVPITPGLWTHTTRPLAFTLVVDDFGIKYVDKADAQHLLDTLRLLYTASVDWDAKQYCGLTLDFDYVKRTCDISIPGYIARALKRFDHPQPSRPQHAPHAWVKPQYGAKTQFAPSEDTSPALDSKDIKRVQEVLGTLLFYARAIDSTMVAAIGTIATQQAKGTKTTMEAITHLLNYCATHPDATVRFIASDMVLWVESDASYLTAPKARSRAAGYHYLSSRPPHPDKAPNPDDPPPPSNGAISILCQIMREVLSSAAEAELAALFHNGKEACPIRITLEELGHPQPATPLQTDNSTASGISNDTVKQKRSKAIDMRFYWIRDRVRQGQFHIYWKRGCLNKADYFTKHHPPSHHQAIRSSYLHDDTDRSKNYFECLQDNEDETTSPRSVHFQDSDRGEGVLISREPGSTSNPETNATRDTPVTTAISNMLPGSSDYSTGSLGSPGSPGSPLGSPLGSPNGIS